MARCDRCDGPESMFSRQPCKWCGYPSPDTRSPEQVKTDDASCHEREWGWDHTYRPDQSGDCITCREQA